MDQTENDKSFRAIHEFTEQTRSLAANQGLYNGFLAIGLVWGLLHENTEFGVQIQIFCLCCVLVAAVFGGATVKKSILLIQGVPALMALVSVIVL